MNYPVDKDQVKKIKGTYRVFCFFICIFSLIGLFGALVFGTEDSLFSGIAASLVPLAILYICAPIVFFGYPPKRLMWTLGKK